MRSMVEGPFGVRRTPPPRFARSPSPRNLGEDFRYFLPNTPIAAVTIASIPVAITVSASGAQ